MPLRDARAAARFYRRFGALLPRSLRDRWRGEMAELLRFRLEAAGDSRWGRIQVWMRATVDLLVQSVMARLGGTRREVAAESVTNVGHFEGRGGALRNDFRHALRGLISSPLFSLAAIGTLALGIGTAVGTFSVVHAVLLRDLPYEEPDQLVTVWPEANFNAAMVAAASERIPGIESITGFVGWSFLLSEGAEAVEVIGNRVSPQHFATLGVTPMMGRDFVDDDGLPDAPGVVILSHSFWIEAFAGDPATVGRIIQLGNADRTVHEVIGVMPEGFRPVEGDPRLWTTLRVQPGMSVTEDDSWYVNTRIARMAEGASASIVQEQLQAFANRMHAELPRTFSEEDARAATVQPLAESVSGDLSAPLWLALGAVGLVLLSAVANVANLLLARGQSRGHAFAVRSALGADRGRMVSLLMSESAILVATAGAVGIGISYGLIGLVVRLVPDDFARLAEVEVNSPVLGFSVLVVMVTILTVGLIPALRSSRVDATAVLGRAGRGESARRSGRLMPALVALQVAMAMVTAMSSGLMLRSLQTLLSEDPGLDPRGILTFRVWPGEVQVESPADLADFYGRLLDRIRAMPGVEAASAIHIVPGSLDNWSYPTYPEGHSYAEGDAVVTTSFRAVWPQYFETVGIPLIAGRTLRPSDDAASEAVTVVNQAFVDQWWPGESGLGKTIRTFSPTASPARVVGVVGNVRQFGLGAQASPEMYYAHRQWGRQMIGQSIVIKFADGDPLGRASDVRAVVAALDPLTPLSRVAPLEDVLTQNVSSDRFVTTLLSAFGALAVALGAIGVFGMTAFTVGRRLPEYGVRIALGASRAGVVRQALAKTSPPVMAGLALGLFGAFASTRLLASVLYEITPTDPMTFVLVSAVILTVGTLATLLPSLRAGRVDPVASLSDS